MARRGDGIYLRGKTRWLRRLLGWSAVLIVFVVLALIATGVGQRPQQGRPGGRVTQEWEWYRGQWVWAEQLHEAYEINAVAADQLYKGKIILVSGRVRDIGTEILGRPYVTLATVPQSSASVQCVFPKTAADEVARLRKGQEITVRGKVDGKMVNILLLGCALHESRSPLEAQDEALRQGRAHPDALKEAKKVWERYQKMLEESAQELKRLRGE